MELNEGRVDVDDDLLDDIVREAERKLSQNLVARMEENLISWMLEGLQQAPTEDELESPDDDAFDRGLEYGSKEDLERALDNWQSIVDYLGERVNLELASAPLSGKVMGETLSVSISDWPEEFQDLVIENDPEGDWDNLLVNVWFDGTSNPTGNRLGQFSNPDVDHEPPVISFWAEELAEQDQVRFEYDAWYDPGQIKNRRHIPIPISETLDFFKKNWESYIEAVRSTARHEIIHWIDYSTPEYVMQVADPNVMDQKDIDDLASYEEHSARAIEFWTDLSSFLDRVQYDVNNYGEIPRPIWKVWLGLNDPLPDSWFKKFRHRGNRSMVSQSDNSIHRYFSALRKISRDRYEKAVKIATSVAERNGWLKGGGSFGDLPESVFRKLMLSDRTPKDVILEQFSG